MVGSGALSLTVSGSGFVSGTTLQVGTTAVPATFVSASKLTGAVPATATANAGTFLVTASNGSAHSAAVNLQVNNPAPGSITLTPNEVLSGGTAAVTIAVAGTGFVAGTIVQVNGAARVTAVQSSTELSFQLTVADQANVGMLSVIVMTPAPGGGSSPAATLTVVQPTPQPVISSVYPTQFYINSPGPLSVLGTNLTAAAIVLWNGSPLATTYIPNPTYGNYLVAQVPTSLLATTGTVTITVSEPTAATSNSLPVSIMDPPVPVVTSISPGGAPLNTATSITITGTGFNSSSTVQFDGTTISSAFVSSSSMTVEVSAATLALPGNHAVTVSTPAPGGGTSAAQTFTAYIGIQNNAMALNPVNGLLYVSVPSSAGAPYGNSVVSVDPATGALGSPIYVGSEPDKLAVSYDGMTLWVGLDGTSAIREVNLTTGEAGMQFSLGNNVGTYQFPPVVHAIAVLPGAPSSIVASVATNNGLYEDLLTIYDSGVARHNSITLSTISSLPAIFVNPTKAEVYATSAETGYQVMSYNSGGLTNIAGNSGINNFNAIYGTAVQVDKGIAYLQAGVALNAETGVLLGTFYSSGTTVAIGPMVSDSSLGKNFVLEGTVTYGNPAPVIQAFNEANFTPSGAATIPVNGAIAGQKYGIGDSSETELNGYNGIDTMVRWGANGLAFRASNGVFSLRSNLVQNLSTANADLGVEVTAPGSGVTGSDLTLTATVTNHGPSGATDVVLAQSADATLALISAASSQGSCTTTLPVRCNLGSIANGATATVTLKVQALGSGTVTTNASVAADQNDNVAGNNSSSASTTVTGNEYANVPVVSSVYPSAVLAGSTDQTVTVSGNGFVSNSAVYLGSEALSTSYVSGTELQAVVPSAALTALTWYPVTVMSPAPGGGMSNALPLSVYSLVNLTANHMLYDPYTRLLYASVASSATQVTGNSVVTVDPVTGNLGTPVNVGSQPSSMALTQDGNYLYVNETGANAVGRVNTANQKLEFSFPISLGNGPLDNVNLMDIAAMPGTDTTVAVDTGLEAGVGLWDVNPTQQTGSVRGNPTGTYTGSSLQFLNASSLFTFDIDSTSQLLSAFTVGSSGLSGGYATQYTLNSFSQFKIRNGIAYANAGGVANPAAMPVMQLGVFLNPLPSTGSNPYGYYETSGQLTEPDPSLGISFFAIPADSSAGNNAVTLESFLQSTYGLTNSVALPSVTGSSTSGQTTLVDFVRWGQDGLALLTSTGEIAVLRGGFVVPGLLKQNAAAVLKSSLSLTHGTGNTLLTLTGSNFIPGVAITWNGSYRTTTIVDATHVTIALTASDLSATGTASMVATNPGALTSAALSVTIN
jgi:hypothetical protein